MKYIVVVIAYKRDSKFFFFEYRVTLNLSSLGLNAVSLLYFDQIGTLAPLF
jgi:hypothetical protein